MSAGSKDEKEGEDAKFDEGHVGVRVRRGGPISILRTVWRHAVTLVAKTTHQALMELGRREPW